MIMKKYILITLFILVFGFLNLNYNKSGISFGVGYRIFGRNNLYWGCSIYYGKYYFGSDEGSDNFMNLEFFKFGKTFDLLCPQLKKHWPLPPCAPHKALIKRIQLRCFAPAH